MLLEQRDDFLAARRGVAADHVADAALQQLVGQGRILRKHTAGIDDHGIDAEIHVGSIDLIDGEQRAV